MNLHFDTPLFALLLLFLPCFWWCKTYKEHYYFPKLAWISPDYTFISWESLLKALLFILMVVALMKPFTHDSIPQNNKKGRDLALVLDASGSMAKRGFNRQAPTQTKFEATIALSSNFIQKRFDDNIGVVLFGTFAYTATPLTYDLEALNYLLQLTSVGIAGESTALGDALSQGIHTLQFGQAKERVIILLSDGYHNAGRVSPKEAVKQAKIEGVKIYTIGIGNPSAYDATLLQTIAQETGAKSYAARVAEDLEAIYQEINTLEPSPIRSASYLNQTLLIPYPLILLFILLLTWVLYSLKEHK